MCHADRPKGTGRRLSGRRSDEEGAEEESAQNGDGDDRADEEAFRGRCGKGDSGAGALPMLQTERYQRLLFRSSKLCGDEAKALAYRVFAEPRRRFVRCQEWRALREMRRFR